MGERQTLPEQGEGEVTLCHAGRCTLGACTRMLVVEGRPGGAKNVGVAERSAAQDSYPLAGIHICHRLATHGDKSAWRNLQEHEPHSDSLVCFFVPSFVFPWSRRVLVPSCLAIKRNPIDTFTSGESLTPDPNIAVSHPPEKQSRLITPPRPRPPGSDLTDTSPDRNAQDASSRSTLAGRGCL